VDLGIDWNFALALNETSLSLLDRACQDPSDGPWQQIVDVYTPLLRHWLSRLDIQPNDADDLIQEILLTVARELRQFAHPGRVGAFRGWLRTILYHRVRDFWRSRRYRPAATGGTSWADQLEQLADERSDASRQWNLEHDRSVMARLLEQVRPRFEPTTWKAFCRQFFDGVRADLVAAELGLSVNSVYVARSRVLGALRCEAAGLIDEVG
jgi:RNA polymerase sigma-70 factor (ECF subfamily)